MRALNCAEVLALSAAILPYPQAGGAWRRLLSEIPWEDFDESLQRCLPVIAMNLSSTRYGDVARAVPQGGRLAGFYRATWTANIVRLRGLNALLDAFQSGSVDYRMIKGMAVCALTDQWGSRRMGDADLVVDQRDAAKAVHSLRTHGYVPRFFRRIDASSPPRSSCWAGPEGQVVDLHLGDPSRRHPSVLDLMLASPPRYVQSQSRQWPLPSPAAMAVHAASHAQVGAAPSDFVQSLVDVSRLLPLADEDELRELSRATATTGPLRHVVAELTSVTRGERPAMSPRRAESFSRAIATILGEAQRLPAVVRERNAPSPSESGPHVRGWLYRPWYRVGQIRHLERLVVRACGGFLREGSIDLPRDRRRKVVFPRDLQGHPIKIQITCRDPYARLLFINGVSYGVLQACSAITLTCSAPSLELSARLLGEPPSREMGEMYVEVIRLGCVTPSSR